jgi:hypothetical protein
MALASPKSDEYSDAFTVFINKVGVWLGRYHFARRYQFGTDEFLITFFIMSISISMLHISILSEALIKNVFDIFL